MKKEEKKRGVPLKNMNRQAPSILHSHQVLGRWEMIRILLPGLISNQINKMNIYTDTERRRRRRRRHGQKMRLRECSLSSAAVSMRSRSAPWGTPDSAIREGDAGLRTIVTRAREWDG